MISVFLDESGTHAGSQLILVGAVVTPDASRMERQVVDAAHDAIADPALWESEAKRDKFEGEGFHFSSDGVAVQERFLLDIRKMDYRGHIAISRGESGVEGVDLLVNMYYTLTRNLALRYRAQQVQFVFEEESRMNSLYARIVGAVRDDLKKAQELELRLSCAIASKEAPILGVTDYLLGVTRRAHMDDARPYAQNRFNLGLSFHLAHLIDFDKAVHRSSRKGIELL